MGQEIERKFLVQGDTWRVAAVGTRYCQGYLVSQPDKTVRVRIAGDRGYLTIKGKTQGISRAEFEYEIPVTEAAILLETLCDRPLIEKVRYRLQVGSMQWEIDEFEGENAGLIMAEIELESEQQAVDLPPWVGVEVSHDARYYNANLAKQPYASWGAESARRSAAG